MKKTHRIGTGGDSGLVGRARPGAASPGSFASPPPPKVRYLFRAIYLTTQASSGGMRGSSEAGRLPAVILRKTRGRSDALVRELAAPAFLL